ncbi:MAG: hypothetical protein PHD15_03880 [Clostridia bacterium]|nr:hypothetical protein [Clostridia bacterium]MDD4386881.1 hypothetical protein [Clostridia bacterium]
MKKSLFLTFWFSFVPGAGQMYQQYMKRGLSILLLTTFFIAVTIIVRAPIFMIPVAIIMMYSFFDTYNIRNNLDTENSIEDEYIWKTAGVDIFESNFKIVKKNSLFGLSLIFIGTYLLFNNVIGSLIYETNINWLISIVDSIRNYLPSILVSIISIVIGIKFISNKE